MEQKDHKQLKTKESTQYLGNNSSEQEFSALKTPLLNQPLLFFCHDSSTYPDKALGLQGSVPGYQIITGNNSKCQHMLRTYGHCREAR